MEKNIHFYSYPVTDCPMVIHDWYTTEKSIYDGIDMIHTTQMGLLHPMLWERGYRIFIHESEDDMYEIKEGSNNERTNRELRRGHNLFKMWNAGEFCK